MWKTTGKTSNKIPCNENTGLKGEIFLWFPAFKIYLILNETCNLTQDLQTFNLHEASQPPSVLLLHNIIMESY